MELKQKYTSKYDKYQLEYINEIMGELDIKPKLRLIKQIDGSPIGEELKSSP
jgi:hypothetical protein